MARKAKKGTYTLFSSLGIYTHLTHTVYMAELRTHSTLKISSWLTYPIRRVFSFTLFDDNRLEIPQPILCMHILVMLSVVLGKFMVL